MACGFKLRSWFDYGRDLCSFDYLISSPTRFDVLTVEETKLVEKGSHRAIHSNIILRMYSIDHMHMLKPGGREAERLIKSATNRRDSDFKAF